MLTKPNWKKDTSKADYVGIIIVLCILPSRNPFKKNHSRSLFSNCEFGSKIFMKKEIIYSIFLDVNSLKLYFNCEGNEILKI